jgi:hypothetical protein
VRLNHFKRLLTARRMLCRIGLANLPKALLFGLPLACVAKVTLLSSEPERASEREDGREFSSPAARWPALASGRLLKLSAGPGLSEERVRVIAGSLI